MHYLKSLFFSFLTIFFSLHIFSGIEVTDPTKLPHVGGDLLFSAALGFLNSLIYPILKTIDNRLLALRIICIAIVLNFAAYALLKLLPLGISVTSLEGYVIVSLVVSFCSFLTNFFEMKHKEVHTPPPSEHPPEGQDPSQ
jgi:hypothetical protein